MQGIRRNCEAYPLAHDRASAMGYRAKLKGICFSRVTAWEGEGKGLVFI
jgi:hypothetical protein